MLKAVLIGNLGGDPDMRYSPDGRPFLRFNVACNYRARSPEGEWQDKTEWVRVTVFGQQAERLSQYLRKGSRVYVDGRLEAPPWTDQQRQVRAGLEVIASDVQLAGGRVDDDRPADERTRQNAERTSAPPTQPLRGPAPRPSAPDDDDPELPF